MLFSALLTHLSGRARLNVSQLYADYGGLVMRRVCKFFDEDEAWDVAHEIFLKVVEKQGTFRGQSSPSTWLYQLTTRHCINRIRDRARRADARRLRGEQPWSTSPPADLETTVLLQEIWSSLDEISARVGVYYFVDGMTQAEISRVTGTPRRTISDHIQALKDQIQAFTAGERP